MKEFVEKLIGRLENRIKYNELCHKEFPSAKMSFTYEVQINAYKNAIEIVNQLAEEYKGKLVSADEVGYMLDCIKMRGDETWMDYYRKALEGLCELRGKDTNVTTNNGWIPCEFELPKYTGQYNVTVVVASELGSFEEVTTLRFENIKGKEPRWIIPKDEIYRVIAWMELPEKYKEKNNGSS